VTCLNVLEHADPRYGGIAISVPAMARAVAAAGRYGSRNAAFCEASESAAPDMVRLPLDRLRWVAGRAARRTFERLVSSSDLVHVHGLWRQHSLAAAHAARRHGKPYLVSAHGMLEPWALGHKGWKKRLYGALVERSNLRRAACLRALTRQEVSDYRRYGIALPAAVVPNGVDLEPPGAPDAFLDAWPGLRGQRMVLFLGRLHPKKGLDVLLRAWAAAPQAPAGHLVIAGPDFGGTRAGSEALAAELGLRHSVTFTGQLAGSLKRAALAAAHAFVLPSFSEGLSMAVLEALAAGVPVVASPGCNLPEIAAEGCGWVVEAAPRPLAAALAEALSLSAGDRAAVGARARGLAERRFSWPAVAAQMAAVYDWVLGGGRPSIVEIFP
jgi:glycosyltransferase involved in cell wall biosynthesis